LLSQLLLFVLFAILGSTIRTTRKLLMLFLI